jgi:ketosteroid isomerase-like protein
LIQIKAGVLGKIQVRRVASLTMIRTASRWFIVALLSFSVPAFAGDPQSTWVYDSVRPTPSPTSSPATPTDEQQVYNVILDQLRYWNAHDIERYMECFWKSPDLLVVNDGEQVLGWAEVLATYQRGFPNRDQMGSVTLQRVKLQKLGPDFFLGLSWFVVRTNGRDSYSTDTMIFQRFPEGWKVISDHSSYLEP